MTFKQFAFARDRILRVRPAHLLLAAACLHVLTALAIYTAARPVFLLIGFRGLRKSAIKGVYNNKPKQERLKPPRVH
jgi:hypothetical protein